MTAREYALEKYILLSFILPHWRAAGFFIRRIEYEDGLRLIAEGGIMSGLLP